MEWKGRSLVIEDVPGLIEGASEGKGLGHEFLKHVERTALLIHLIDASLGEEAMIENYRIIRTELENWGPSISEKPEIIILSKADLIDADMLEEMKILFENATGKTVALTISAGAYIRIDELRNQLLEIIPEKSTLVSDIEEIIETPVEQVHYDLKGRKDPKRCQVVRRDDGDFEITGERLEEIVRMTDVRYIDGINRVYDVLEKFNVLKKIKAIVREEMLTSSGGFFEGEDDIPSPSVYVAGKKFSLENVIFMREGRN
jgi:GTP-binding protein